MKGGEGCKKLKVVTIYAAQASERQMDVFEPAPPDTRKVSVALPFSYNTCVAQIILSFSQLKSATASN